MYSLKQRQQRNIQTIFYINIDIAMSNFFEIWKYIWTVFWVNVWWKLILNLRVRPAIQVRAFSNTVDSRYLISSHRIHPANASQSVCFCTDVQRNVPVRTYVLHRLTVPFFLCCHFAEIGNRRETRDWKIYLILQRLEYTYFQDTKLTTSLIYWYRKCL